jgi:hypothetical protein
MTPHDKFRNRQYILLYMDGRRPLCENLDTPDCLLVAGGVARRAALPRRHTPSSIEEICLLVAAEEPDGLDVETRVLMDLSSENLMNCMLSRYSHRCAACETAE